MYTPVNPSFTIKKWGLRGSKLYRHVFVMTKQSVRSYYHDQGMPVLSRQNDDGDDEDDFVFYITFNNI